MIPNYLDHCTCAPPQCLAASSAARLVMAPSPFERHAGAGSSKKWKASCRVADPGSQSFGRPVIAWLQQNGYEQGADDKAAAAAEVGPNAALAAAAAALGVEVGASGGSGSSSKGKQRLRVQQQQQQQVRQMRLLLAGMPLLQLPGRICADTSTAAERDTTPDDPPSGSAADVAGAAALPAVLPGGCFGASWQLPGSAYHSLPAVEQAASKGSSNSSSAASPSAALKAAQEKLAAAGAAGSSRVGPDGLAPMRGKRARILKDGSLTLIPYGHDENMLWLQRVHSFIGAVR
jgi:hypothetical protein